MLFNSFSYALFLPIVFILYWIMPQKFRWIIILLSSYYFYISWGPQYVAVILLTTLVSYAAALLMEGRHNGTLYSRTLLTVSVIICIAILFFSNILIFYREYCFAVSENIDSHTAVYVEAGASYWDIFLYFSGH